MSRDGGSAEIPGRAFPARSSREIAAALVASGDAVRIVTEAGETLAECPRRALSIDAPVGRAPRRATFPDGTLFEASASADIDALDAGSLGHRLHRAERFSPRLILFLALAVLGVVAIWRYALPALVWVAVAMTPAPLKSAIGSGTLSAIDRTIAEPTTLDSGRQSEVRAIFEDLLDALPAEARTGADYSLHFRDIPGIGPNAAALPDGTILITDALVHGFPDDDVIAGVLAHEIGHVDEDHGLTQLYRSLGIYVMVSLIAGDTGPILEDVLLEGGVLLSLSYSRDHERAADDYGLRLADRAGYDPAGLLVFFEGLSDIAPSDDSWLSTHPGTEERIGRIRDYLDQR